MNYPLNNLFSTGEAQQGEQLVALPLFPNAQASIKYISLTEALKSDLFKITEVDEQGSVSALICDNQLDVNVLIVESEEIKGAKQNRIINISVLVPARSKVTLPASCTESGRWRYNSVLFQSSGNMMHKSARLDHKAELMRKKKMKKDDDGVFEFASDQSRIWGSIADISSDAPEEVKASTALSSLYSFNKKSLEERMESFQYMEGQSGIALFEDGRLVGLEFVSDPEVYKDLHEKNLKSFLLEKQKKAEKKAKSKENCRELLNKRLEEISKAEFKVSPSAGLGQDARTESDGYLGNVLDHQEVVHFSVMG